MTKYIEKSVENAQTGADAKYHEITALNIDYINDSAVVTLASYVSLKMRKAGKGPLSFNAATLTPAPARDINPHDWALETLIKAVEEGYTPPEYGTDPHMFAGGTIKDNA